MAEKKEEKEITEHIDKELIKPQASWIWIKDANGSPSVTVTFAAIAFWVTTLSYILSIVERIGSFQIRAFDVSACSSYLIPILSLYFGRKFTDAKFGGKK